MLTKTDNGFDFNGKFEYKNQKYQIKIEKSAFKKSKYNFENQNIFRKLLIIDNKVFVVDYIKKPKINIIAIYKTRKFR